MAALIVFLCHRYGRIIAQSRGRHLKCEATQGSNATNPDEGGLRDGKRDAVSAEGASTCDRKAELHGENLRLVAEELEGEKHIVTAELPSL